MGRRSKWERFRAVYVRYRRADWRGKQRILEEFCANTRYHRKYALRLLNGPPADAPDQGGKGQLWQWRVVGQFDVEAALRRHLAR